MTTSLVSIQTPPLHMERGGVWNLAPYGDLANQIADSSKLIAAVY